jgi:hypothetical protein
MQIQTGGAKTESDRRSISHHHIEVNVSVISVGPRRVANMRNGLQRVGVVASVWWVLGSGTWFTGKALQDYSRWVDSYKTLQSSAFNVFHFRIASSFGVQINGQTVILRKRIHAATITRLTSAMQTEHRGILSEQVSFTAPLGATGTLYEISSWRERHLDQRSAVNEKRRYERQASSLRDL